MNWTSILVFADGSDNGLARAEMAGALAAQQGASLEVCVPACMPKLLASGGVEIASEVFDEVSRVARDDASAAATRILLGLRSLEGRLRSNIPEAPLSGMPRLAGALARTCDVTLVGQPIAEDLSRLDDALLEGALLRSGRPCLMLPRWNEPREWGKRILIAWKGTREAARAVHDALPLLQRAEAIRIFQSGEGTELDGEGPAGLSRLAGHLTQHGVRVEAFRVGPTAEAGRAILNEAGDWSADLIVMGGYGHSAFRERALGGATRSAIRSSKLPVLLSH